MYFTFGFCSEERELYSYKSTQEIKDLFKRKLATYLLRSNTSNLLALARLFNGYDFSLTQKISDLKTISFNKLKGA